MASNESFKSKFYLSPDAESREENPLPQLEPDLLEGEIVTSKAENVLHLQSSNRCGTTGNLFCTNFRICFVTVKIESQAEEAIHNFIGTEDILLCNVSAIYQISKDKKKRLMPSKINAHPKRIHIHCKDVSIHCFSFENLHKSKRNNLVTAMLHYSSPKSHQLLFAHNFSEPVMSNGYEHSLRSDDGQSIIRQWKPPDFKKRQDFAAELARLGATKSWRVTELNRNFELVPMMPEYFPVFSRASDQLLCEAISQYANKRLPMWAYTHGNGCSLVSAPILSPELAVMEKKLTECLQLSVPTDEYNGGAAPLEINLTKSITDLSNIQTAFAKMFTICVPVTETEFYSTDNNFHSQLDSAHWLRYIAFTLRVSRKAARRIHKGKSSVIIKEEGADLSCLVSSIVQILLDPFCRTIRGFQCLVQRCWVAAGHPFCDRLSVLNSESGQITPVFLLFLDCVHQLTVQYPSAFELSEIYLISLWDSCLTGLFREFIYNTHKDRFGSSTKQLHSVWDWNVQYPADYIALFRNPLYEFATANPKQDHDRVLKPRDHLSQIDVWISFFYRNTSHVQITNGGKPVEYFQQCLLMEEITELQNQMAKYECGTPRTSMLYFNPTQSSSLRMRNKLQTSFVTSTFPFKNKICRNVSDISLCTMLELSDVLSDRVTDEDT